MKPVSRTRHVATAEVGEATESFLDVLRSEQFRYLDSVAAANEMLRHEPGRVALIAAIQNRLTQQFFDAQRSIIMRQAVYDTEVGRIEARAEADVDGIVAAARSRIRALAAAGHPLAPPSDSRRAEVPAPEPGVALARRTQEALAGMAASSDVREPDPDSIQRQLGALLDQWWSALNQDGQAQIDHAHARAAMRRHVAAIESDIVELPSPAAPSRTSAAHLPQRAAALPSPVSSVASMAPTTITSPPSQQPVVLAPSAPSVPRPPAARIAASSFAAPVVPAVVVAGPAVTAPTASGRPAVSPVRRPDASLPAPALGRAVPMTRRPAATIAIDLPARLVQAIEAAPIDDLRSLLETLDQHLRAARPHMPESVGARPSIGVGPMPAPLSIPAMPAIPAISSPQPTRPPMASVPSVPCVPLRSTSTAVERASNDLVIRDEPAGSKSLARLDSIDTGAVMGGQAGSSDGTRRTSTLDKLSTVIPVRIVMPMVAATSAIALVMALVG